MNFLSQQFSFTISGAVLFSGGLLLLIGILAILLMVISLIKKVRSLETPKYGFLGKPLYTLVSLALMGLTVYFVSYNFIQPNNFDIKAEKNVSVQFVINKVKETSLETTVDFKLLPTIDNVLWGPTGTKLDIYWNVTGPMKFDEFELGKNASNPSGFQKVLKKGKYQLKVRVVFDNEIFTFTEEKTL